MVEFPQRRRWVIDLRELASNPDLYGSRPVPDAFRWPGPASDAAWRRTSHSLPLSIIVARACERSIVTVADTGSGMTPEFIQERLFKPFDSTKGSAGVGIGAYQVRDYVRSRT